MRASALSRAFVVVRGLLYSYGFVLLWAWLAISIRPLDARLAVTIPAWLAPLGFLFAVAGALLAALCIGVFVTAGRGTPAPFDPPRVVVAVGPYRWVRNPMYLGAAAVLLGAGLMVESPSVVLLAIAFLAMAHVLVILYEEPALSARFGDGYERYKASVHRWLIRRPGSHGPP